MLCCRNWLDLYISNVILYFEKKGPKISTYYLTQAALPIVKKCGVFERKRSIFCGLPQCSQLLSLQNCSSNRTGSSAKDLTCTRKMRTSSQHFLHARILMKSISTYARLSRQQIYCIRHTFVVWGERASSLWKSAVYRYSPEHSPHLQLICASNFIPKRLCVGHMQSPHVIGFTRCFSISLFKLKREQVSDICNPMRIVATISEVKFVPTCNSKLIHKVTLSRHKMCLCNQIELNQNADAFSSILTDIRQQTTTLTGRAYTTNNITQHTKIFPF